MRFLILAFGVFLVGCAAQSQPVVMVNSAGRLVQCGPYSLHGMVATSSAIREQQCIEDYKQQGYVRQ
jgi:hypothetical protein